MKCPLINLFAVFAEILIWIINILKVKVKAKVQKRFCVLKQEMTV